MVGLSLGWPDRKAKGTDAEGEMVPMCLSRREQNFSMHLSCETKGTASQILLLLCCVNIPESVQYSWVSPSKIQKNFKSFYFCRNRFLYVEERNEIFPVSSAMAPIFWSWPSPGELNSFEVGGPKIDLPEKPVFCHNWKTFFKAWNQKYDSISTPTFRSLSSELSLENIAHCRWEPNQHFEPVGMYGSYFKQPTSWGKLLITGQVASAVGRPVLPKKFDSRQHPEWIARKDTTSRRKKCRTSIKYKWNSSRTPSSWVWNSSNVKAAFYLLEK